MSWSPQQDQSLKAVGQWLKDPHSKIFRLFGYAGTGKTTIAKEIAGMVSGTVLFMCFTGKASLVLRKKGCPGAGTIHSNIYRVEEGEDGRAAFTWNPDGPVTMAKLVIVDEVSMVDEELALDLLRYGVKVLVLGDPHQLPPVRGEGYFINAEPDFMLTEVHRQAADNPIIRMSMDVREGKRLRPGTYGDSLVVRRGDIERSALAQMVLDADQVLCGLNKTRLTFNNRYRELTSMIGLTDPWLPVTGDRLVCLKNDHPRRLLNGGLWEVKGVSKLSFSSDVTMRVVSLDEPDIPVTEVKVPQAFFKGEEKELDWRLLRRVDQFTYGYALTVHKSQGSQWDNVLLYDESGTFREDASKHLYTGITRAAERVTVVV